MRHMLKQSAEEQNTSPAQLQCNMDSLNHMVEPLPYFRYITEPTHPTCCRPCRLLMMLRTENIHPRQSTTPGIGIRFLKGDGMHIVRQCCCCCMRKNAVAYMPSCAVQIAYCEEQVECRRSVLLAHFGEAFDVKRCHGTCDVCAQRNGQEFEQVHILVGHLPLSPSSLLSDLSGHGTSARTPWAS